MGRQAAVVVGVVMVLLGALWTAQGLGYVGGSAMTGSSTWAIIGPAVAGLGIGLIVAVLQRRR